MTYLLGTKIGMTRVFDESGRAIPVTALQVGPCYVMQVKTVAIDGYSAIKLGFGVKKHPNKPEMGQAKELDNAPQFVKEFRLENPEDYTVGQVIDVNNLSINDSLKITGTSKGKGFSGVIKRHNFARGPQTHGSDHHRAPGSIGAMYPQHVLKGQKMPGHMGNEQVSIRKVKVVDILADKNVILVKGPVPGTPGNLIELAGM